MVCSFICKHIIILKKFWAFIINLFLLRMMQKILQLRHILHAEHLLYVGRNALQDIMISILLLSPIMFEISVNSILFSLCPFHNIFIVCSIETNFLISSFILFFTLLHTKIFLWWWCHIQISNTKRKIVGGIDRLWSGIEANNLSKRMKTES